MDYEPGIEFWRRYERDKLIRQIVEALAESEKWHRRYHGLLSAIYDLPELLERLASYEKYCTYKCVNHKECPYIHPHGGPTAKKLCDDDAVAANSYARIIRDFDRDG